MPVFGLKRMNSEYSYMGKGQNLLLLFVKAFFLAFPSAVGLTYPKEKAGEKDGQGRLTHMDQLLPFYPTNKADFLR